MSCFEKSKTLNSMTLFFLYIYIFFFYSDFIDHIKSRKSGEEGGGTLNKSWGRNIKGARVDTVEGII